MNNHINDTTYLQKLINDSHNPVIPKHNPVAGDDIWIITQPLILESDKKITLDGAHLRLADGVYSNIFSTEYPLGSEIKLKKNISIIGEKGAVLDGGVYNGLSEKNMCMDGRPNILNNTMIFMRGVENFEVRDIKIIEQRYWGMTFHYCWSGEISGIVFEASNIAPNQDGIDLRLGCHDVAIENISGTTGDDTVALTALYHGASAEMYIPDMPADIYNVTVRNIDAACTGGHGIIRLLCHDGLKVHDIIIENVTDRNAEIGRKNTAAVRIGDLRYSTIKTAEDSDMYNIIVRNIRTDAPVAVKLHGNPAGFVCEYIEVTDGQVLVNTKQ